MEIFSAASICAVFGLLFGLTPFKVYLYALFQLPLALAAAYATRHQTNIIVEIFTVAGALSVGQMAYVISSLWLAPATRPAFKSQN